MIRYVADASCVAPLIIPDEAENLMPIVFAALDGGECIVPGHWHYEIGNLSLTAVRRGRVELADILANLQELQEFPIRTDDLSAQLAWSRGIALAQEQGLTLYDAAYLELAQRLSLTLLSMDRALLDAAARVGVPANPEA